MAPLLLDPNGPVVVALGGGHGQAAALEAIQCYAGEISALVAVGDDGGSSGRLSGLGIPPPGDVRRCLLALTPEPSLWSELFSHRFTGGDVAEHSLGNLILAGLADLFGDFESAVETAERMLGTLGSVIPVADQPITLTAIIDGREVSGQKLISQTAGELSELYIEPSDVAATRRALAAVAAADQIVIGPGSLYTSILSALKVNMLAPAIMGATSQRVFVLNLITQDGETLGMSGADHVGPWPNTSEWLGRASWSHTTARWRSPRATIVLWSTRRTPPDTAGGSSLPMSPTKGQTGPSTIRSSWGGSWRNWR
jgi:uncharacterized cofD-like protein